LAPVVEEFSLMPFCLVSQKRAFVEILFSPEEIGQNAICKELQMKVGIWLSLY
jgi:hypothetical protein